MTDFDFVELKRDQAGWPARWLASRIILYPRTFFSTKGAPHGRFRAFMGGEHHRHRLGLRLAALDHGLDGHLLVAEDGGDVRHHARRPGW